MGLFFDFSYSWIVDVTVLGISAILTLYMYFRYKYKYWKSQGINYEPASFPWGNLKGFPTSKSMGQILTEIYNKQKHFKFLGLWFFYSPVLLLMDLDLIKNVLVRDFKFFQNRGVDVASHEVDPLSEHLFGMEGKKWRNLRVKLTPAFTSGKMKMMFPVILHVSEKLQNYLEENFQSEVNVKDVLSRFMMDVISSCAFGLESHCMENPNSEFFVLGQKLMKPDAKQWAVAFLYTISPKLAKFFKVRLIPKDVSDFFINTVEDTINTREREKIQRQDFLQLLIELKNNGVIHDPDWQNPTVNDGSHAELQKFSINQVAAQVFVFFFAGFETTASTLQYALYELALRPELQKSVQDEIEKVMTKHNNEITYNGVHEMDLLGRIVAETLRKYPIAPHLFRACSVPNYKLDDGALTLEEKMTIVVPVYAIHHDPEHYPNPEKFDPDRFLPEEKEKRHHYAYLPFGEGPRNCIGNRFALIQIKTTLALILAKFTISASENTPIPLEFDPTIDLLTPKKKIHLKFVKK